MTDGLLYVHLFGFHCLRKVCYLFICLVSIASKMLPVHLSGLHCLEKALLPVHLSSLQRLKACRPSSLVGILH